MTPTCDYCGNSEVAGEKTRVRVLARWRRWTLTLTQTYVRVCMKCLGESGAPLTADQLAKIAEIAQTQDEP